MTATNDHTDSDEALAQALQQGDDSAFDVLVQRHQTRVYAVAYRMMGNREDALDVSQEVFIKAYRRIDAWKPSGKFAAWLTRLTTNQAIDHLRRRQRHRSRIVESGAGRDDGFVLESVAPRGTESHVAANEIDVRVQRALGVLSPSQRAVFVLRHYEGKALAEIAVDLGCTVGSVKVHLFRALKKLRGELGDLRV